MTEQSPGRVSSLHDVRFGIGTWAWGDRLYWGYGRGYEQNDVRAAFQACLDNGIRFFDTAEVYGQGQSETMLGQFVREAEEPVKIATKFMPFPWRLTRRSLVSTLRKSLKRLGVEKVDLYQIHFPIPPMSVDTWMGAMADAYQLGLTTGIGVSNYNRGQTQQAYDALTRQGIPLEANQVEYHLLNRKIEKNGLMQHCKDLGVTVIAYSPLAMGMLTGKYTPDNPPGGFRERRYNRATLAKAMPLINEMKKIGSNHGGKSAAQVAINWVICKGALPIPGAKNARQAEQNAGALGWSLSEEEVQRLDELSDQFSG